MERSELFAVCELATQRVFTIAEALWQRNCQEKHVLQRYLALPIQENDQQLWLAIDDEKNLAACEIFAFLFNKKVEPVVVASEELKYLLNALSPEQQHIAYDTNDWLDVSPAQDQLDFSDPIIQILDSLFKFCLAKNASDIHIEPYLDNLLIRLRIDGVLHIYKRLSSHFSQRILSRLKLLAKLDISEVRLPQDGQFSFTTALSETLDFRVSTLPTYYGEKMVLRVQKNKPTQLDFLALGFTPIQQECLLTALKQPQGLILVTGPTGSGKSITLYTALTYLNQPNKHILTAEDPIEIVLDGIVQTQVNRGIQLDFSQLIRTFLRQDPDIIMVGEIRDEESAKMALRAAQTGHLVLSTLHTNDAPSAIERLMQLGIKEYEIRTALLLVVAQRLLRRLCTRCSGAGCEMCYEGYQGRVGVYQLLSRKGAYFEKTTAHLDFATLLSAAQQKISQGITSSDEVTRVLGSVS